MAPAQQHVDIGLWSVISLHTVTYTVALAHVLPAEYNSVVWLQDK